MCTDTLALQRTLTFARVICVLPILLVHNYFQGGWNSHRKQKKISDMYKHTSMQSTWKKRRPFRRTRSVNYCLPVTKKNSAATNFNLVPSSLTAMSDSPSETRAMISDRMENARTASRYSVQKNTGHPKTRYRYQHRNTKSPVDPDAR